MVKVDVRAEVVKIISEWMVVSPEEVRPEYSITDDLGADSLDCIEMTMSIEDKFKIEIPAEDAAELTTVDKIIKYVESKVIK